MLRRAHCPHHPRTAQSNVPHCPPCVPGSQESVSILPSVLVAQMVKNPPAMQEMGVRSPGRKDPLQKRTATPVFGPGEPHGERSLVGSSPWASKLTD